MFEKPTQARMMQRHPDLSQQDAEIANRPSLAKGQFHSK